MLADQLKARWDISPPPTEEVFYRHIASLDSTATITSEGPDDALRLVIHCTDGSLCISEPDGTYTVEHPIFGKVNP